MIKLCGVPLALILGVLATSGCVRSHELSEFPLEAERDAIRAETRPFPTVYVQRKSPTGGPPLKEEVSPLLGITLHGVQLDERQPIVPWNEVQSISTVDHGQGARIGLLAGTLLGAGFGAIAASIDQDCQGSVGCHSVEKTAMATALVGAILGLCSGAVIGYRNTWSKRGY